MYYNIFIPYKKEGKEMNSYGKNIKLYRKENHLKQEELAEKLGISSNMLGKIERGERKPNKDVQEKMFNISGIKYEDEIINELTNKLEKYLLDYFTANNISKQELSKLQNYFRQFNDEKKIEYTLNKFKFTPNNTDNTEYYVRNIFFILEDFYNSISKQYISQFYKDVNIFILNNIDFIMELLSRMESSIFIHSRIPLYKGSLPLNTHSKTDEYLSNIQTNKYKFACIVQDNTMSPKFEQGHTIVVLEDDKYSNGDDVLISINNEIPIIRKIMFKDKIVILQTYNDTEKTDVYSKDEVKILGRIIEVRYT